MANNFSKQEMVMFDDVLAGFEDRLVIGKATEVYTPTTPQEMERSSDKIWRPIPYIATSYSGFDQTANFGDITQLSVPVTLGQHKSVPLTMTSKNLRDPSQLKKFGTAAMQKLASDVNGAVMVLAALQGSNFSKRTAAASGFDDVAAAEAMLTDIGVAADDRYAFYSTRDYNSMASNLASRVLDNSKSLTAYEKSYVGEVSGFETFKNDISYRLAAATATTVKVNGANQYYVPVGSTSDALGNTTNVDNRYQTITISVGASTVKVGDAFTVAGVNSVHKITKQDTGQLKTFRVVSIVTGAGGSGTIQITPPFISAGGGSRAELEYQNISATPADQAVITFLNTTVNAVNPFFKKQALEIIPGSFAVDPEDGWQVMRAVTEMGLGITYARQGDINTLNIKARWDVDFGVGMLDPEMCGAQMFSQA